VIRKKIESYLITPKATTSKSALVTLLQTEVLLPLSDFLLHAAIRIIAEKKLKNLFMMEFGFDNCKGKFDFEPFKMNTN
jgi:hypothetical protein